MNSVAAKANAPIWKRLRSGVAAGIVSNAINYGGNFFLVSGYLHAWGAVGYGRWLTIMAIISYISLADLGGQVFVQNRLALYHSRGDDVGFSTTLAHATALYLWIGATCSVIWVLSIVGLHSGAITALPAIDGTEAFALIVIGLGQFLLAVPFGIFATGYRATGHFSRSAMLGNFGKLGLFGGSALALWTGGGIKTLATVNFGATVLAAVLLAVDSRRLYRFDFSAAITWRQARAGAPLLAGSFFNWLVSVCSLVVQQTGLLVLAAFSSATAVAEYSTHKTIANLAGYLGTIMAAPILPEFALLLGRGDRAGAWRLFHRAALIVALGSGLVSAGLVVATRWFFPIWTTRRIAFNLDLMTAMGLQAAVAATVSTNTWILLAHSEHKRYAVTAVLCALSYVLSCYALAPRFDALGIVWSGVAIDLVSTLVVFPALMSRVLGLPFGRLSWANARITLLAAGIVTMVRLPFARDWTTAALLAVFAAGAACAGYSALREERGRWA